MEIKNGIEDIDYVVCQICKKKLRKITNTHLKKHNIIINDYHKKYPGIRTECKQLSNYRKQNIKDKTYEQIYGEIKGQKLKQIKKEKMIEYDFVECKCDMCGKIFIKKENEIKKYCSVKCGYEALRKGNKIINCLYCDKEFNVRINSIRKFCSHECADNFNKEKKYIDLNCPSCGKIVHLTMKQYAHEKNRFCSKECSQLYRTNKRKFDYRKKAYEYNGKYCQRCNTQKNLVVHHIDGNRLNNDITNLQVLCRKCHSLIHTEIKKISNKFVGQSDIEQGMILMLNGLRKRFNLDITDINFRDTPKRVARAYEEIFEGINADEEIKKILSVTFPTEYNGMIIESSIRCYSMCPHHFLPVTYDVVIGYIPRKGGLGLSKLARLVELLAKAPKLQEDFTKEIIDKIQKSINPLGAMVYVKGDHLCMQMRGVKKPGTSTITSSFVGNFDDHKVRSEFLTLIDKDFKR